MKNLHKQIILMLALITTITLVYWSHITYDSQSEFERIKHPAVVTFKNFYLIEITDSKENTFLFKRNDMLGNSLMNTYLLNDTIK